MKKAILLLAGCVVLLFAFTCKVGVQAPEARRTESVLSSSSEIQRGDESSVSAESEHGGPMMKLFKKMRPRNWHKK